MMINKAFNSMHLQHPVLERIQFQTKCTYFSCNKTCTQLTLPEHQINITIMWISFPLTAESTGYFSSLSPLKWEGNYYIAKSISTVRKERSETWGSCAACPRLSARGTPASRSRTGYECGVGSWCVIYLTALTAKMLCLTVIAWAE